MKTTYSIALIILTLFFSSFSSEKLPNTITKIEILKTKKASIKKVLTKSKKQKRSFKERIAIKFLEKKAKKLQNISAKKQTKKTGLQQKNENTMQILVLILAILLILTGLVTVILLLLAGKTLLGILLLFSGLIIIPILYLISLGRIMSNIGH